MESFFAAVGAKYRQRGLDKVFTGGYYVGVANPNVAPPYVVIPEAGEDNAGQTNKSWLTKLDFRFEVCDRVYEDAQAKASMLRKVMMDGPLVLAEGYLMALIPGRMSWVAEDEFFRFLVPFVAHQTEHRARFPHG